ncbi:MAG: glycoside hydrolase family 3 C-terminal domain-containing protein [Cellulomonadaceae bacterium]|jgi:beta-glucosidase|nr:glycoside hydrolase family 3 C-terminal domain-containing protein [Cellulomonadaceae bacterium]
MADVNAPEIPAMPQVSDRVRDLVAQMTLDEKLAQIVSFWPDQGGNVVAPMQGEMATDAQGQSLAEITANGLGQYTRVYGTRPVDPIKRAEWLWAEQRRLKKETRLGIPALVHEECLTGLAAWQAATFPTPLAWGMTWNPELVYEMGKIIGESMHALGIHLGLAPVMDVIRDHRWGRVDECISEDPYLVGTVGTAYVKGLQDAGVHATLKHFLGYGGSRGGRNHAPVYSGQRELMDIYLPPFEMAILDGHVKSVMNAYNEIDGIPVGSSKELLTDLLRLKVGFEGTVVADYFAVAFLEVMHAIAANRADAAALALTAGIDVELPGMDAYPLLAEKVRAGEFDERYIDRAVLRHLSQKEALGLLDPEAYEDEPPTSIDLDSPAHRDIARRIAEESVMLLSNDGGLPLTGPGKAAPKTIAVIGPNADRAEALQGCYSFANHVLAHFPEFELGIEFPTIREALVNEFATLGGEQPEFLTAWGCDNEGTDTSGFAEAVDVATKADVAIVCVGDQAGLFGRGTVGEGNDAESLDLPGVQEQLIETLVATGTPVVVVLVTGRTYAIDFIDNPLSERAAAVIATAFPGECGAEAIAGILTGRVNPSGRLPVSAPRSAGSMPFSYLHPLLGGPSDVTTADSTPLRPFGFGLSYTTFEYSDLTLPAEVEAGGEFTASVTVTNTGDRDGTDVVQMYFHDVIGSITRPVVKLLAFSRVDLKPGESKKVTFRIPTQRFAFSDRSMRKIVEPGDMEVWVASHSAASTVSADVAGETGGGITAEKKQEIRKVPGASTPRQIITVTGDVYYITNADARLVDVSIS